MGNYKTTAKSITVGNVTTSVPNNATVFELEDAVINATAADGMLIVNNNSATTAYQVATGKTFRLLGIIVHGGAEIDGSTLTITQGDTENAETLGKLTVLLHGANQQGTTQVFAVDITFAAGKFITNKASAANINHLTMIGYEL